MKDGPISLFCCSFTKIRALHLMIEILQYFLCGILMVSYIFDLLFQALSANDLTQVLFVCERVNRESLMISGNSKLSQEVLMSLINQLSHDLGQKTDLKMK